MVSIGLWHALVLLMAILNPGDFAGAGLVNWYTASVALVLIGMAGLAAWMRFGGK